MESTHSLTGNIVAAPEISCERYQLQELLGEGGSGSTYRAIRLRDGVVVAIKILSLRHLHDWKQLELFEREAKVLSQLNHPQIPEYLEYFHVDTPSNRAFYIVQQLAPGKPLTAWIQEGWRGTETEIRTIAGQLLEILQYLHSQTPPLIHRDIKPHNIIRNDDGRVFLVDFGSVQNVYHNTLLKGSTVAGTYGYMAPEQFRGLANPVSDLYGVGATMLYLLTHRSPADLPQERLKLSFRSHVKITDHFADWLEMMLEPDTVDRFPSTTVALEALQKEHRFRARPGTQTGFPWKGAIAATIIAGIALPLFHHYRYAFLTVIGLQPRDLCGMISHNDVTQLRDYLNHGGSINAMVSYDSLLPNNKIDYGSLLHCAITHRRANVVKDLLQRGANPNGRDHSGLTPLHYVAQVFYQPIDSFDPHGIKQDFPNEIMQELVKYKADINAKDSNGESSLSLAVKSHNTESLKSLLALGADPHAINNNQSSLWHVLAWYKYPNNKYEEKYDSEKIRVIAQQLLDATADFNAPNADGNTPLHLAIKSDNLVLAKVLLEHKADFNRKNNLGQTPLTAALKTQGITPVQLLLSHGVGVNVLDGNGETPLMVAVKTTSASDYTYQNQSKEGHNPVGMLLAAGADPNLTDLAGNNAVHALSRVQDYPSGQCTSSFVPLRLLDLLVKHYADRQAVNKEGDTALHHAARQGYWPLIERLVGYGWQPSQKNRQGATAVEIAAKTYDLPVATMQVLISPGQKSQFLNRQDSNGNTLLHRFVQADIPAGNDSVMWRIKTIRLLAQAGADFQIRNKFGQKPLDTLPPKKPNNSENSSFPSIDTSDENTVRSFVQECESLKSGRQK